MNDPQTSRRPLTVLQRALLRQAALPACRVKADYKPVIRLIALGMVASTASSYGYINVSITEDGQHELDSLS